MYYRNADAAVLVYDVTDADSFEMLQSWYHELQKNVPDCIIVLAGNKIDLDTQRKVRVFPELDLAVTGLTPFAL